MRIHQFSFSSFSQSLNPNLFDDVSISWCQAWTAREALRSDLFNQFKDPRLLDLNWLPKGLSKNVSISHSKIWGIYAVRNVGAVGVDIENSERISKATIQRVSTAAELSKSPDFKFLWPAKEASLKCAFNRHSQDLLITDVSIDEWTAPTELNGEVVFQFRWKTRQDFVGFGLVIPSLIDSNTVLAISI